MSLWAYRGEGNAHIVVSHKQKHIVYRMFKRKKNGVSARKKIKNDYQHLRDKVLKYLAFTRNVMLPRIDRKYLHCGSLVEISPRLAQSIKASLANRPEYRKDKELDENCPYVLEMPDYCHVTQSSLNNSYINPQAHTKHTQPVYTIEIKPKWGFLPVSKFISHANRIKHSVCRYCMHQHQKVATGKWKYRSYYCPLDLFSGDRARMKHALKMLFATPQNNLRIFKDGKVLWNDLTHELRENSEETFLREFCHHNDFDNTQDMKSYRCEFDGFLELLVQCLLHDGCGQTDCEPAGTKPADPSTSLTVIENGRTGSHCVCTDSTRQDTSLVSQTCTACTYRPQNGFDTRQDASLVPQTCTASTYKPQNGFSHGAGRANVKSSELPKTCVLYQVLKVQLLDDLDIEGIEPLYELVKQEMELNQLQEKRCPFDFIGPYDANWFPEGAAPYPDQSNGMVHAVKKIKEFLVSRSAKDCSIMISIQKYSEPSGWRPVLLESSLHVTSPVTPTPPPVTLTPPTVTQTPPPVTPIDLIDSSAFCPANVPVAPASSQRNADTADVHPPTAIAQPCSDCQDPDKIQTRDSASHSESPAPESTVPFQRSTTQKSNSSFIAIDSSGQRHLASIAVIDLDPKPFDRLPSYIKEDREVVKYYMDYLCSQHQESLF